ncbi:DUF6079 family protein [Parabacteroides pacaensis]|uniref:DUF6079 family protein n=1 Tax=Parabacteroides pacaensis TaxID=2086575 RepID=UPI000D10A33C|nr:DUF6079 family protein [Parabacteroides pacaensis]
MKYKDLIQFDPIDEIIKFSKLDNDDYRTKLVKNFVCSNTYETFIIPQICAKLDLNATTETKGIQIVGNCGTGKSHLMSLFSIIAENAGYLPLLQSRKAKDWLKTIAGKYRVYRFELGNHQELWDIITYKIDIALEQWDVDYSISDDNTPASYSEKLERMMAAFEEKYPDKGFMLVIDEMLSYLKGRSEPSKLNRDLAVLQALGQMSDRTHFRMVFGVQELIYRSPEFQFAKEMLNHVNERYIDLTIQKEDVQFIVQQRLLLKNEHQKAQIRQHLSQFTRMFPNMQNNLDTYINLFPVHPSYFDNFSLIRIGKGQREVLKTLSNKFASMLDKEIPSNEPGLICYDSYWKDMQNNVDLKADPDVSKVSDITALIDQKIEDNFTRGLAPKKALAHRIVAAAAIKILQAELSYSNGISADSLANDLCHIDPTCETYDELVDLAFSRVLESIVTATIGQYFEKGDNEYHLRIEGGVNYEQKVKDYASQMSDAQKNEYFYLFLAEVLPIKEEPYRRNFHIWAHQIEWPSHKCERAGYIFMGNPNNRSTTQPQQHFYIYFMPVFDPNSQKHQIETDSIYFLMDGLNEEFKQKVTFYGSALSQEGSASSDEKPRYKQLREKYFNEARNLFNTQFLTHTIVEYMGEQHPMQGMPGAHADSKIDAVNAITSYLMEQQFEMENAAYPKFSTLAQPLTRENRDNLLRSARQKIASPNTLNRNGEAILMGLGLWKDGRLSTEHSQYARSLKQKLAGKNGLVLNRDEILEAFHAETQEYLSSDFHIEADLEMLVMATMAALGEIEIVLSGGTRINASNIANINNLSPQDNYTFSNICPPKGLNIALIRELMIGLLGVDRTSELDNRDSSVFAELLSQAQLLENRIVMLQHKIHGGYYFASDIEVISDDEANHLNREFDTLKNICNQMQRYNTKAKMRNIDWSMDTVRTAMQGTRKKLEETENMLQELNEFSILVSYLRTALSNINEPVLREDIQMAISNIKDIIRKDQSTRNAYKADLEILKNRYADWYMGEYVKAHISEMDYSKKQRLTANEHKQVCDDVHQASFINPSRYVQWLRNVNLLKLANPNVTKQTILSMPTAPDGFNPTVQRERLPEISKLQDELEEIYNEYIQQFHDALEDPAIQKNQEMLNTEEKATIQQFTDKIITLDHQYTRPLIDIINKLQRNFMKIEISHDDILRLFSRPMTKHQAIDTLAAYIDQKSQGHRPEDVRIIIK